MARLNSDELHNHRTWGPILRPEYVEAGRLHRHRIDDPFSVPKFTTWERNTRTHRHRLPDGAWCRPRLDLLATDDAVAGQRPAPSTGLKPRPASAPPDRSPPTAGWKPPAPAV